MVNIFLGGLQPEEVSLHGCADEEREAQSGGAAPPPSSGLSDGDGKLPKAGLSGLKSTLLQRHRAE